jgi:hypothetical protein
VVKRAIPGWAASRSSRFDLSDDHTVNLAWSALERRFPRHVFQMPKSKDLKRRNASLNLALRRESKRGKR